MEGVSGLDCCFLGDSEVLVCSLAGSWSGFFFREDAGEEEGEIAEGAGEAVEGEVGVLADDGLDFLSFSSFGSFVLVLSLSFSLSPSFSCVFILSPVPSLFLTFSLLATFLSVSVESVLLNLGFAVSSISFLSTFSITDRTSKSLSESDPFSTFCFFEFVLYELDLESDEEEDDEEEKDCDGERVSRGV